MTARTPRGRAGAAAGQVALAAWYVLPLVPLVIWAVATRWPYPEALPTQWGGAGPAVAGEPLTWTALGLSGAIGLATALIAVPAGAMAAFALPSLPSPLRRATLLVLLSPVLVPPLVIALGINVVLLRLRIPPLLGVALVLALLALPYVVLVMRAALVGYDRAVEDQARLLGAAPRDVLWRIRAPLLARPLVMAAFLAFLVGWTDYVVTLIVGGGSLISVPLLVGGAASGSGNDSRVAVLSVLAVLPPLALLGLASIPRQKRARNHTDVRPPAPAPEVLV